MDYNNLVNYEVKILTKENVKLSDLLYDKKLEVHDYNIQSKYNAIIESLKLCIICYLYKTDSNVNNDDNHIVYIDGNQRVIYSYIAKTVHDNGRVRSTVHTYEDSINALLSTDAGNEVMQSFQNDGVKLEIK